jgi:serpin B
MITRRLFQFAGIALVSLFLVPSCASAKPNFAPVVVRSNNTFAFDLYQRLSEENDGNLFFSPFSMSSALAMTYGGARGETADQMREVFHFDLEDEKLHETFGHLVRHLNQSAKRSGAELKVANALWGQEDFEFKKKYRSLLKDDYISPLERVNFRGETEQARGQINRWASDRTNGRIEKLLPRGILNQFTRLVLTNAIYFKASWIHPFEKERTETETFTRADGSEVRVPMMNQTEQMGYMETDDFQMLSMPYEQAKLSMLFFLPKKKGELDEVAAEITEERFLELTGQLTNQRVAVTIPKFKLTTRLSLSDHLRKMGMVNAFDPQEADFTGMSRREDMHLQAVVHKAYVDVDEKGTEAAAATGVVAGVTAMPPGETITFRADHPFLFLIRDRQTDSILFMGRVSDPS